MWFKAWLTFDVAEGVAIGFAALGFAIVIPRNIWGGLIFQFIVGFLVTAER